MEFTFTCINRPTGAVDYSCRLFEKMEYAENWLKSIASGSSARRIQTTACVLSLEDSGIVVMQVHKGASVGEKEAKEIVQGTSQVLPLKPTPHLVDIRGLKKITWEARRILRENDPGPGISRLAFVTSSFATTAIGSVLMSITKSSYPTRIFRNEIQARAWLLEGASLAQNQDENEGETISTRAADVTLRSDGILASRTKPVAQALADAEEVIRSAKTLTRGGLVPFLLDIRHSKGVDREARNYYSLPTSLEFAARIAILVGSKFSSLLGNTALLLFRRGSPVPMRIFSHESEAVSWLKNESDHAVVSSEEQLSNELNLTDAEELLGVIARIASQDFSCRVNVDGRKDSFAALGGAINILGEELEHSVLTRDRFRLIINTVPAVFYSRAVDGEFSLTFIGENVNSFGHEPKTLMEQPALWQDLIHPDDRPTFHMSFTRMVGGGGSLHQATHALTYRLRKADGKYFWVRDSRRVIFDSSRRPVEIVGFLIDIDDETHANSRAKFFYGILDKTSAFAFTNTDGVITDVNDNFCRGSGYSRSELIGATHRLISSGKHDAEFFRDLWETIRSGKVWQGEIINRRKDGVLYWLESTISPVFGARGEIEGFIGIQYDITARKQAESHLIHAMKMATLGEMSAGIAHEINNPLMIINSKCRLLERKLEQSGEINVEALREDIRKITKTTERIEKIIRGLKAFARTSEQDPFENVEIDLVIEDSLALCRDLLHHADIKVRITSAPGVRIKGRASQLSQVLVNLVGNAIDAMRTLDEKWIQIEAIKETDGSLRLKVTDAGSGISKEVIEKIMMPFFTTKEVGKGTGLGLSISKGIIEDHGGRLYVDTAAANTCFILEFPSDRVC